MAIKKLTRESVQQGYSSRMNSCSEKQFNSQSPLLLLTPFEMYTSYWEEGANHDQQMIRLLKFLYGGNSAGRRR
ncbi:hypothetical protein [Paenibacillus agricola]|uniref:Uncharacterized protein n=1 Tax=Paenibacillus agricola TaxID=2716264 RepID=A0ABX0JD53_9BACL|nr:hypothetical protein [Paenibacillus agricola]NHN34417.1 hypothetical protein [Paenibacillus agricola]